ncbi:Met-10+ like-protein-domain-containing protein [Tuber brumale]|nr:Met-10+ like-protein-domain-containing protein [Tuber brumale]
MFLSRFLPPVNRAMRTLDRAFFRKVVPVTAARVLDSALVLTIKEKILKDLIPFERFNQRYDFNSKLDIETPLLILRPQVKYGDLSTVSDPTREYVNSKILELVPYDLKLEYGDWGYEEIMKAVLPEDADPPDIGDFPRIGPLLHLDVPGPLQEYRKLIAEVICDKEREVQTVFGEPEEAGEASKLGFANEVLAGPPNYHVELSHQGSSFTIHLDNASFRGVYFDTKLAAERQRLVDTFGLGECVADVYSGVGALSVAAAKRGAIVFANEQRMNVYNLLVENRRNNKVKKNLNVKNQTPTKFVQHLVKRLFEKTVDHKPHKRNKLGVLMKNPLKKGDKNLPSCVSHFVFGDPDQSLTHLECLRGIYTGRERLLAKKGSFWKIDFPFVHVYAYHKAPAEKKAYALNSLLKVIGKRIGHDLGQECVQQVHFVKKGSTDNLYCITFKLPPPVAFGITEEKLHQRQLEMVDPAASKEAAIPKSDDREPGRMVVTRTYLPSRDPNINRFGPSGKPPSPVEGSEEKVSEPTPFPGAPTQIAPPSATLPTSVPAYSPARAIAPQRPLEYTPLASFQPRDARSVATGQSQGVQTGRPPMGGGHPMTSNPGSIKTESELMKEFAKTYKEPQGLPPWKLKVHRKESKAAWMAIQIRKQQEHAYLTQGGFNPPHRNNNEQLGSKYWASSRGERRFHSDNSPTQLGYGPYGYTECVAESVDRHSVSQLAAGSKDGGHANREETRPSRPLIRFHIAANKTPQGGPIIRWHQVDTHPRVSR